MSITKKQAKAYIATWVLSVALFIVFFFAIRGAGTGVFQNPSWPLAMFCLVSLVIQLAMGCLVFGGRHGGEDGRIGPRSLFLGMPGLVVSSALALLTAVCGLVFINVAAIPTWVGVLVLSVLLALDAACCLCVRASAAHIVAVDESAARAICVIAGLRTRADALVACASDAQAKAAAGRVAEALRLTDPVSNDLTTEADASVQAAFVEFEQTVRAHEADAGQAADKVLTLVAERASLCKQGKRR